MECPQTWQDRLDRLHEQPLKGDVFRTDDLRLICEEIIKNPETQISSAHYLRLLMLLIQQHESHQNFLIGLPQEAVELLVGLAEKKEPIAPEAIYLRTA